MNASTCHIQNYVYGILKEYSLPCFIDFSHFEALIPRTKGDIIKMICLVIIRNTFLDYASSLHPQISLKNAQKLKKKKILFVPVQ